MFVVNGKILSKKENPELFKWYQEKIDIIKDDERQYFVFSSTKVAQYEMDDSGRKRKIKKYKSIPSTSTFINEKFKESQTWTFVPSANSIRNENGMISVINQKPFMIGPQYILNKDDDADIIFFLLYVSQSLKNKHIYEVDRRRESKEKAKKATVAAEAQFLLYHETSPISPESIGSDDAIRQIAMSFGLPGVIDKHIDEVRNELWDKILVKEGTRDKGEFGFEGFIKATKRMQDTSKRAIILTAVEHGFLYYKDFRWYIQVKGTAERELCNVPSGHEPKKNEYLIAYILENKEFYDLIKESVNNPAKFKIQELDVKPSRMDLIGEAVKLGWERKEAVKKTNVELTEIIENNMQPAGE